MELSRKLFINLAFAVVLFVGLCYLSKAQFLPLLLRYSICTILMASLALLPLVLIIFSAQSLWKYRRFESLLLLTFSVLLAGFFVGPYTRMTFLYAQATWQQLTGTTSSYAKAPAGQASHAKPQAEEAPMPESSSAEATQPSLPESYGGHAAGQATVTQEAQKPMEKPQAQPQGILEISSNKELKDLIARAKKPVVIKVSTTWCGPCKMLKPHFDKVAEELGNEIIFVDVDGDAFDGKGEYGIKGFPTLVVFNHGKEVHRFGGYREKADLREEIVKKLGMQ